MADILESLSKNGRKTASSDFNATLPDAPHGSNLFTHLVPYREKPPRFFAVAACTGIKRPGCFNGYKLLSEKQSGAADAGRSLR